MHICVLTSNVATKSEKPGDSVEWLLMKARADGNGIAFTLLTHTHTHSCLCNLLLLLSEPAPEAIKQLYKKKVLESGRLLCEF